MRRSTLWPQSFLSWRRFPFHSTENDDQLFSTTTALAVDCFIFMLLFCYDEDLTSVEVRSRRSQTDGNTWWQKWDTLLLPHLAPKHINACHWSGCVDLFIMFVILEKCMCLRAIVVEVSYWLQEIQHDSVRSHLWRCAFPEHWQSVQKGVDPFSCLGHSWVVPLVLFWCKP